MAKTGSSGDIRAGGAFVQIYLKGGSLAEKQLEDIANRARRFSVALETTAKISSLSFGKIGASARAMASTVNKAVNAVVKSSQKIATSIARTTSKALESIPKAMQSAGQSMSTFGMSTLMTGMVGAGAGARSMTVFGEYERQMSRVKALSTGANDAQLSMLADKAKELGRTTEYTAANAAEGLAYLAMAGLKAEDQLTTLPVVLDVATAAMMEMGQAADIITDVGTAFGYMGDQTVRVADVLATAATNSNTNIEMMGHSFRYLASFANNAGQSIEDMAATVALIAGSGIKASTAGTGTREALISLITGPKKSILERTTGVKTTDEVGNVKPLLSIVKELKAALSGVAQGQRLELLTRVFGKRGGNVVLALMQRTNEEIDAMRQKMINADGAAKKMAETMRDNLWGSFKGLVSAIEAVQIAVGEALTPAVRGFIDMATSAVRETSVWIGQNREVAVSLAIAVVAILGVGAAIMILGKTLSVLATIATPVFSILSIGMMAVGTAATIMMGMVGTAVTGVITLVAALPGALSAVVVMTASLGSAVSLSIMLIAGAASTVVAAISAIPVVFGIMASALGAAFSALGAVFAAAVASPLFAVIAGTLALLSYAAGHFHTLFRSFGKAIEFIFNKTFGTITSIIKSIGAAFVSAGKTIVFAASNIAIAVGKAFVGAFKAVAGALAIVGNALVGWFNKNRESLARFIETAKQSGRELVDTFNAVVTAITSGNIKEAIDLAWLEVQRRIIDAEILARKAIGMLVESLPGIIGTLGKAISYLMTNLGKVAVELWTTIKEELGIAAAKLVHAAYELLKSLPGAKLVHTTYGLLKSLRGNERLKGDINERQPKSQVRKEQEKVFAARIERSDLPEDTKKAITSAMDIGNGPVAAMLQNFRETGKIDYSFLGIKKQDSGMLDNLPVISDDMVDELMDKVNKLFDPKKVSDLNKTRKEVDSEIEKAKNAIRGIEIEIENEKASSIKRWKPIAGVERIKGYRDRGLGREEIASEEKKYRQQERAAKTTELLQTASYAKKRISILESILDNPNANERTKRNAKAEIAHRENQLKKSKEELDNRKNESFVRSR